MRSEFLKRTFRLVLAGVAIGLAARWMFGIEAADEGVRRFNQPLDPSAEIYSMDIPLGATDEE